MTESSMGPSNPNPDSGRQSDLAAKLSDYTLSDSEYHSVREKVRTELDGAVKTNDAGLLVTALRRFLVDPENLPEEVRAVVAGARERGLAYIEKHLEFLPDGTAVISIVEPTQVDAEGKSVADMVERYVDGHFANQAMAQLRDERILPPSLMVRLLDANGIEAGTYTHDAEGNSTWKPAQHVLDTQDVESFLSAASAWGDIEASVRSRSPELVVEALRRAAPVEKGIIISDRRKEFEDLGYAYLEKSMRFGSDGKVEFHVLDPNLSEGGPWSAHILLNSLRIHQRLPPCVSEIVVDRQRRPTKMFVYDKKSSSYLKVWINNYEAE